VFGEHSCRYDATVSYVNSSIYGENSAQLEQNTMNDTTTPLDISIPVATYAEADGASLGDNFGLVLYDLSINKTVNGQSSASVPNGSTVSFVVAGQNTGPTTAYNVVITDTYGDYITANIGGMS
jgi:uncharacterized repeat protein (TIGR01451 family)